MSHTTFKINCKACPEDTLTLQQFNGDFIGLLIEDSRTDRAQIALDRDTARQLAAALMSFAEGK